jgi:prepilin-type N-terminal cleavage/methylation domain-containing protein
MTRETPSEKRLSRGFTLVEMLVVIFIIGLLAALLLPMVMRSFRQSTRLRTQGDFQAVMAALEAYRSDFGDIPRVPIDPATGAPQANTGAAILGKALLGPFGDTDVQPWDGSPVYGLGDCVTNGTEYFVCVHDAPQSTPTTDTRYWASFDPRDGATGPGFKTRAGAGKTYGPYVDPTKFKSRGCALLDSNGGAILYFPARPGVNVTNATASYAGSGTQFKYNLNDNLEAFRRPKDASTAMVQNRILVMLDDLNLNGIVDKTGVSNAEKAVDQPYLLWSAGPDGMYGPNGAEQTDGSYKFDAGKPEDNKKFAADCDDVTNFR